MLKVWGAERSYVCIDTFSGFVPEQFAQDERLGTEPSYRSLFDYNSRRAVERTFRHLGHEIEVIEGDISTLADKALPEQISVCLLDVDLAGPIHDGLRKVFPRIAPGGIILVDDCQHGEESGWRGADVGYRRFVGEMDLPERYETGFGVIELPQPAMPGR
jgi:hypothetical protein